MKPIREMTYDEVMVLVLDDEVLDSLSEQDRLAVDDKLGSLAWSIGRALDKTHGIDPFKCRGARPAHGTPNKRSYTYKVRKAVGYSYP